LSRLRQRSGKPRGLTARVWKRSLLSTRRTLKSGRRKSFAEDQRPGAADHGRGCQRLTENCVVQAFITPGLLPQLRSALGFATDGVTQLVYQMGFNLQEFSQFLGLINSDAALPQADEAVVDASPDGGYWKAVQGSLIQSQWARLYRTRAVSVIASRSAIFRCARHGRASHQCDSAPRCRASAPWACRGFVAGCFVDQTRGARSREKAAPLPIIKDSAQIICPSTSVNLFLRGDSHDLRLNAEHLETELAN